VVGVARTTYYEHKFHIPSDREIRRLLLSDLVADIHQRSRGTYGMIRISAALKKEHDMIVNCCAVLDLFTRRIVGWSIDRRCEAALVNDALTMANNSRRPGTSTIIHSDHGTQFTSWGFTENVRNYGLMGSMGTIECATGFGHGEKQFWNGMVSLTD